MDTPVDLLLSERSLWSGGYQFLAGVDEAGRGPLAGPVVAAAVIFSPALMKSGIPPELCGLTDSKQLSARVRAEFLSVLLGMSGVHTGLGMAEVEEIDRLNILRATHLAMRRALEALPCAADFILVDGRPVPGLPVESRAMVRGDSLSLSIAAASVVAKETRDRIMLDLDQAYPAYGFARHKGYGTKMHLEALSRLGPSPCHRTSFRPVRELLEPALFCL